MVCLGNMCMATLHKGDNDSNPALSSNNTDTDKPDGMW